MKKLLAALVLAGFLACLAAATACPRYAGLDDCLARCTSETCDMAAYLGSCDYYCRSEYSGMNTPVEPTPAPTPTAGQTTCANTCREDQTQGLPPSCACMDIPPCPQRQASDYAEEPRATGMISNTGANIFVYRTDAQQWCSIPPGSSNFVFPGESLKVFGKPIVIRYYDGTQIDVKPGSEFTVKAALVHPDGSLSEMLLNVARGVYRYVVPPHPYGKFELSVDDVQTGIQGTEFVVEKNPDGRITIYLLEGAMEAYGVSDPALNETFSSGQKIVFAANGDPGAPEQFSPGAVEKWWATGGSTSTCGAVGVLLLASIAGFAVKR